MCGLSGTQCTETERQLQAERTAAVKERQRHTGLQEQLRALEMKLSGELERSSELVRHVQQSSILILVSPP